MFLDVSVSILAFHLAARISEIYGIQVGDIVISENPNDKKEMATIKIGKKVDPSLTKTGQMKNHRFGLTKYLYTGTYEEWENPIFYLKTWLKLHSDAKSPADTHLFRQLKSNNKIKNVNIGKNEFQLIPSRIDSFLGLQPTGRTFHCFKRSVANTLLVSGGDITKVAAFTGNSVQSLSSYVGPELVQKQVSAQSVFKMEQIPKLEAKPIKRKKEIGVEKQEEEEEEEVKLEKNKKKKTIQPMFIMDLIFLEITTR